MTSMPTVVLNTSQTTFVSSAQPNNNLSFYPVMYVGTDATYQTSIGLLKFDLSSLPVSSVDSAILELTVIQKTGASPSPVTVNRVTSPLDTSTVTYNTLPTYVATATQVNVTAADLFTAVSFDITALVNGWLNGTYDNNGIALTNSDGTTVVQFATNNIVYEPYFPRLVVQYTAGTGGGIQAQLINSPGAFLDDDATVVFDTVITNQTSGITYNMETGEFTISAAGNYYISWWTTTDGSAGPVNMVFALNADGSPVAEGNSPIVTGQVNGDALLTVAETPVVITLTNTSGASISYGNINVQANITIFKLA
jgi:C1q domain-containing protein